MDIPRRYNTEEDEAARRPVHVVWELTLACDLKCQHCGSRAGPRRRDELSTAQCFELVRGLARLGARHVTLIGGEAYLRKDWLEIIRAVRGEGMDCTLQTGGLHLTPERIDQAAEAGLLAAAPRPANARRLLQQRRARQPPGRARRRGRAPRSGPRRPARHRQARHSGHRSGRWKGGNGMEARAISDRLTFSELLVSSDVVWRGRFELTAAGWRRFNLLATQHSLAGTSYGVSLWPIDYHCHGIGRFDFTEIPELALEEIDDQLAQQGVRSVLTLYLPKVHFEPFLRLMRAFDARRRRGGIRNICGIGLEGPLLASHGGTPRIGAWSPTRNEWQRIAACGELGLRYVVLSPDAQPGGEGARRLPDEPPADVEWIVDALVEGGVRPALGHFLKSDPVKSASAVRRLLGRADRGGRSSSIFVSDHLFNDMPLAFTHAFRGPAAQQRREQELGAMRIEEWSMDNLEERLGPVPAALMHGARDGLLTLCLNFDGEHVDLAICKRVVELLGADRIIAMTDRIQNARLGGQSLTRLHGGTLLYQSDGIVAAGSRSLDQQMSNMRSIGLSEMDIWQMVGFVPARILGLHPEYDAAGRPRSVSVLSEGRRVALDRGAR